MRAIIRRLRQLRDIYPGDATGATLALVRDASAEVLRQDAAALRALAEMDGCDDASSREASLLAGRLTRLASATTEATTIHARCVHEARVAPRLAAVGPTRCIYVDSSHPDARASAGATSRYSDPDGVALQSRTERGVHFDALRSEGVEIESHVVRHARKKPRRGKRGGKKHTT